MRKITEEAVNAFNYGDNFKKGNTRVATDGGGNTALYLHGNKIAYRDSAGDVFVSNCGWTTNTTKERLNGLSGVSICQTKFVWFLNGKEMPINQFVKV